MLSGGIVMEDEEEGDDSDIWNVGVWNDSSLGEALVDCSCW